MLWLVEDFKYEQNFNTSLMIKALNELDAEYKLVKTIPFEHIYDGFESKDLNPSFVYGSTLTVKAAQKYGFYNAIHIAPTENAVRNAIGTLYLNHDMVVLAYDEVECYMRESEHPWFFIKPDIDLKSFDGTITDVIKYPYFIESVMAKNNYDKKTKICVSTIKNIEAEWRVFVVDGVVSTYSRYMVDRKISKENSITKGAYEVVCKAINILNTSRVMVVDVCKTKDGYFIIEYNTPNCSGVYDCDVKKFITDVNRMK